MRRTTIYLPDELKAALERTATAEGRSEAEIVRSALTSATAVHAYPPPRLPLFNSGDPNTSKSTHDLRSGAQSRAADLEGTPVLPGIARH